MKIYLIYLLPKKKLYAITINKKYMERFLSERDSNLFKVITKKLDDEEYLKVISDNNKNLLQIIPLEDNNGDYEIIGTIEEDDIMATVCENIAESCIYLKRHFTENVPFKNEYKELILLMTTISKDIDCHPIIQIDTVKLFYHLFKETFIKIEYSEDIDDTDFVQHYLEKYKNIANK